MKKGPFLWLAAFAVCVCLSLPVFAQGTAEKPAAAAGDVTLIVHHKVADFEKWLPHFEGHAEMRKQAGCTSATVYQAADDPNMVTIITTFASLEQAKAFGASEDLKNVMQAAGVQGAPDIHLEKEYKKYAN